MTKPSDIQRLSDAFSVRTLIKPEHLYNFLLGSINRYYFDKLAEYRELTMFREETFPSVNDI